MKRLLLVLFFSMFCSSAFSQDIDFDTTLIRDLDAKALLNFLDYPEYIKKKDFVSYKVEKLKYFDTKVKFLKIECFYLVIIKIKTVTN